MNSSCFILSTIGRGTTEIEHSRYCCASVGGRRLGKSKVVTRTVEPVWNLEVPLDIDLGDGGDDDADDPERELILELWDRDRVSKDDSLGRVSIPLSNLRQEDEKRRPGAAFRAETFRRGFDVAGTPRKPMTGGVEVTLKWEATAEKARRATLVKDRHEDEAAEEADGFGPRGGSISTRHSFPDARRGNASKRERKCEAARRRRLALLPRAGDGELRAPGRVGRVLSLHELLHLRGAARARAGPPLAPARAPQGGPARCLRALRAAPVALGEGELAAPRRAGGVVLGASPSGNPIFESTLSPRRASRGSRDTSSNS